MLTILFAALGIVAASAVQASDPVTVSPIPAIAAIEQAQPAAPVRPRRYCISDRREGAPRRPKICRTRDEWRARGFDPLVAIGQL